MNATHPSSSPAASPLAAAEVLARRDQLRRQIPSNYSPLFHLLFPSLVALLSAGLALAQLHQLRPLELLSIPLTLFLSFAVEWQVHKDLLHRRMPLLGELYERHERFHHVIYTHEDMAMRSRREMRLVLMPSIAIVLVVLLLVPMGFLTMWLTTKNCALLTVCTGIFFFISYEWLHLSYHLPATHPIARLGLIRRLSLLHRIHHNPRNMKRWNMNVTIPLFDLLYRSYKPEDEAARRGD
jgi:hypothetical protein